MLFETDKKLDEWIKEHKNSGCISHAVDGVQFRYEFTPTSAIEFQSVRCVICGKKSPVFIY